MVLGISINYIDSRQAEVETCSNSVYLDELGTFGKKKVFRKKTAAYIELIKNYLKNPKLVL